ncbi:hypothetical protein C8J57DRAFT_1245920 [Mycena rebaudengoi]|nr:hypothetical protein C8J57DRAFT_1245920 [Mycena rebaudengoi]
MLFSANVALTAIAVIGFAVVHAAPVPALLGSVHPFPRELKGFGALIASRSELLGHLNARLTSKREEDSPPDASGAPAEAGTGGSDKCTETLLTFLLTQFTAGAYGADDFKAKDPSVERRAWDVGADPAFVEACIPDFMQFALGKLVSRLTPGAETPTPAEPSAAAPSGSAAPEESAAPPEESAAPPEESAAPPEESSAAENPGDDDGDSAGGNDGASAGGDDGASSGGDDADADADTSERRRFTRMPLSKRFGVANYLRRR